ncbi:DNA polymerase sliding clamp [Halorubrum sp. 48-1-W]|uniref:DNA polymerase sliding clamp n=1 Tax=Halorubrum sp. 48-1-W TaxID=2249761 RepID=UPI000DCCA435|nr:DNA polymerase sliding clamp [Halorubrum sp. 48-1-W]RAW44079.1 DNA polymerase sliding clamp [Halorubrum sp. 48-1-W]
MSTDATTDGDGEAQDGATIRLARHHLEEYLNALNALVDEAVIRITDTGLETRAVDPANVGMVGVDLSNTAFTENYAGEATFGINTRKLGALVERLDTAFLDLDYDAEFRKATIGCGPYTYTHATTNPDHVRNEPDIPDMDLSFKATVNSDQLREAVEWFDEFTTHIRMGYAPDDGEFWMKADERMSGNKIGTDDGEWRLDRSELGYVDRCGRADSQFSIDFLRDMARAIPEDRPVTIRIGEEFPMKLTYEVGWEETGANEGFAHGEVTFFLAPRIQSD